MTESFICELPLQVSPHEERTLDVRLEAGRHLYNGCLGEVLKRLKYARNSLLWEKASPLSRSKERSKLFQQALKQSHFSEYELHTFVKKLVKESWIRDHIDSQIAQKIASRAFQAVDEYARKKRGRPRFKGPGQFSSIEGKSNLTGIRFKNGCIHWKGLVLKPIYDLLDKHGVQAHGLSQRTKYVRLVRRTIRGKRRFYAQLIQEGKPLIKKKHLSAKDKTVGLDIGPSSIAIVSEANALLRPLSEFRENQKVIKTIQKALTRSRRKTNPDNFDEKGIPLKGKKWKRSHRYLKTKAQLAEQKRTLAARRKTEHGTLANQILSLGTHVKTEQLSYKSFQRNFGRSTARHAPGLLLQILRRKAENAGGQVIEFSPFKTKLSQVCHACGKEEKKSLSQRWHICSCGLEPVQRDLYSAFLALHVDGDSLNRFQAQKAWASADPLLRQALLRCEQTAIGERKLACFGLSRDSQRQSCLPVEGGSTASEVKRADKGCFEELAVLPLEPPCFSMGSGSESTIPFP